MRLYRRLLISFVLLGISAGSLPCLGADAPKRPGQPPPKELSERDRYFVSVLQSIVNYSQPGVGVDANNYLPLDHVRIDPDSSLTWGSGSYTAASKIAPYLLFLLKIYQGEGLYANVYLIPTEAEMSALQRSAVPPNNKTLAVARMQRALDTIEDMMSQDKLDGTTQLGGMVAWVSIYPDGRVLRDKDFVPLLDNGLLSWAYAAILGATRGDPEPMVRDLRTKVETLLGKQDYTRFYDAERNRYFGEIDVQSGKGNPAYYLERFWTEDMLAVLWSLLVTPIPPAERMKVWDNLACQTVEWTTSDGEKIDVPLGYVASNHELVWSLLLLPLRETAIYPLFRNSQFAQADFARRNVTPGFLSTGYDSLGAYTKMGVPGLAEHPELVQRTDCAIVFATAAGLITDPPVASEWLYRLIKDQNLLSDYGPLEAVGPGGRADILTADSQYLLAIALGGGVAKDVRTYLAATNAMGTTTTGLDLFKGLMARNQKSVLANTKQPAIRSPSKPFPQPPVRDYAAEVVRYAPQMPYFDIMAHIVDSPGDRHGAGVFSPRGKNMRWDISGGVMAVEYEIPADADDYSRFAWWGTYLDTNRPYLAGFTHLRLDLPNDGKRHYFNVMLKREDTTLVQPIVVDSAQHGTLSEDGEWKTYTFRLTHRKRFVHLPLTYIAFSVDDPMRNPKFPAKDEIRIRNLVLLNNLVQTGQVDVAAAIQDIGRLPRYIARPTRPAPLTGSIQPHVTASGSIGGSTEDISREKDGVVYFEFDSVDITNGFSGAWIRFDDLKLNDLQYIVFDAIAGPAGPAPNLLRVECKQAEGMTETLLAAWNVRLATPKGQVARGAWARFVLPIPRLTSAKTANMIAFVYENYVGGIRSGSLEISSPTFLSSEPASFAEGEEPVVRLSPPLAPDASVSLMPSWLVAKGDMSRDVTFALAKEGEAIELSGNGGWIGARLYPSIMAQALGNTLTVELEPLSDEPCAGVIELKGGRVPHVKTKKFTVAKEELPEGATTTAVEFPMFFRTPSDSVDYVAISGIRGKYRIHSIRTSFKAEPKPEPAGP